LFIIYLSTGNGRIVIIGETGQSLAAKSNDLIGDLIAPITAGMQL
jgi:hypothetical protein